MVSHQGWGQFRFYNSNFNSNSDISKFSHTNSRVYNSNSRTFNSNLNFPVFMTSIIHVWQRRVGYWQLRLTSRCRHPAPGQNLIPLQRLHVFAHSSDPHPAIKLWCQVPFTQSKTTFQIEMYCMQCFLKSKYIKSRTFNDKNRWIIKKVMVFKKLLHHLATRGTYSPGDWRCDGAWREQTLVYPPVMCQQRLIYCTWELNVMFK